MDQVHGERRGTLVGVVFVLRFVGCSVVIGNAIQWQNSSVYEKAR